jgi:hypothetical protein
MEKYNKCSTIRGVAGQIDIDDYEIKHVRLGCTCSFMELSIDGVARIIRRAVHHWFNYRGGGRMASCNWRL